MKKANTQVGFVARSIDAIDEDGVVVDEALNQLISTCKKLQQARKKQKTHIGQAYDHVTKVSNTVKNGVA